MKTPFAFWDSSAIVPLCVHEDTSPLAHSSLRKFKQIVWWAGLVEVHGGISRMHRAGDLNDAERNGALAKLTALSQSWREILPSDQVRESAMRLLDAYVLRAADSLQLAAALAWCKQYPANRSFLSGDQRLCKAAELLGFSVVQL